MISNWKNPLVSLFYKYKHISVQIKPTLGWWLLTVLWGNVTGVVRGGSPYVEEIGCFSRTTGAGRITLHPSVVMSASSWRRLSREDGSLCDIVLAPAQCWASVPGADPTSRVRELMPPSSNPFSRVIIALLLLIYLYGNHGNCRGAMSKRLQGRLWFQIHDNGFIFPCQQTRDVDPTLW